MKTSKLLLHLCFCLLIANLSSLGQKAATTETGPLPFKAYSGGKFDHIQMQNGTLYFRIPLFELPQLGRTSMSFSITGQSDARVPLAACDPYGGCIRYFVPANTYDDDLLPTTAGEYYLGAGALVTHDQAVALTNRNVLEEAPGPPQSAIVRRKLTLRDGTGGRHQMGYDSTDYSLLHATDGSGWSLKLPIPSSIPFLFSAWSGNTIAYDASGNSYELAMSMNTMRDPMGNAITANGTPYNGGVISNNFSGFTDSVGRSISYMNQTSTSPSGCPILGVSDQPATSSVLWSVPGPNGGNSTYRLCYTSITLKTNFWGMSGEDSYYNYYHWDEGCQCDTPTLAGWIENHGSINMLQSVVLPDNTRWAFIYDSPSTGAAYTYGDIVEIRTPEGGTLKYEYSAVAACGELEPGPTVSYGPTTRGVTKRTASAGSGPDVVTTYHYEAMKTTETTGGNDTEHIFTMDGSGGCGANETTTKFWQGMASAGSVLKQVDTAFSTVTSPQSVAIMPTGPYYVPPPKVDVIPTQATTQMTGQDTSTVSYDYETLFTDVEPIWDATSNTYFVYGYSTPIKFQQAYKTIDAAKTVVRPSKFTQNVAYKTANLLTLKDSEEVIDNNSGALVGLTNFHYDGNNGSPQGIYGNLTSVQKWLLGPSSTSVTTSTVFNAQGQVTNTTDPNGNSTAVHSFQCGGLFPLLTTQADGTSVALSTTITRDCVTGLTLSMTDPNGITSTYDHSDPLGRLTARHLAIGKLEETHTLYGYPFRTQINIASDESAKDDGLLTSSMIYDGLGRISRTIGNAAQKVDTAYDNQGNIASVSNPYITGTATAAGITYYEYDALGRETKHTDADGTQVTTAYSGNAKTTSDEAGKSIKHQFDSLGQLSDVYEDPTGLNLHTHYTYDVLGNLLTVNQIGVSGETARTRSFTYDSLSRLITSTNPETGTICYGVWNSGSCVDGYDNNGNLKHKTDARNVTTNYTYDALNRLQTKTYSDGTPSVGYGYDGKDASGATLSPLPANPVGRLTHATGQTNVGSKFSYDPLGRLKEQRYCVPQECSYGIAVSADYDLAGNQIGVTYPDGRRVATGFDTAGRISSVSFDKWGGSPVNSSYLSVNSTGGYDPAGHLVDATMGNGVHVGANYNNRLLLSSLAYTKDSASLWSRNLTWLPNGNLQKQTDPSAGIERQFTYDSLNRLTGALDVVGSASGTGTAVSSLPSGSPSNSSTNVLPNANTIWGSNWDKWQVNVTDNGTAAPDGSMTATVLTAQGGATDAHISGHLGSSAGVYTYTAMTGSVWLRSPGGSRTLNLYLIDNFAWGNIPVYKQVTVTPTWQQFEITETAHNDLVDMQFQIGGAGSYTSGELDVWGARLEPSPSVGDTITNFLPYSQRLTATNWGINHATVTDNNADAPDGTHTAATLAGNATDAFADGYVPTPAPYSGTAVTGSVYLRVASGTKTFNIYVVEVGDMGWQALAAQTVTATTAWQRFQLSGTTQNALTQLVLQVGGSNSLNAGDTVQVWGAQMELGSVMNPYVATGSSSASRGANFTNLLAYSQRVYGAPWQMGNGTASNNSADAPDGTHTAMTVTPNSGSGDTYIYNEAPYAGMYGASKLTASVYLRVPSGTLSTNLFLINNFGVKKAQPITLTTTWQRFSVTDTAINGLTQLALQVGGGGTVVSGQPFQMWGAQMEAAASVGPYVRTEAVPVTAGGEFVNLLPFSQQPNGPTWWYSVGDTVAVNAATAPDGTATAATVTHGNSGDTWVFNQAPNPALYAGSTVTGSVYLRSPGGIRNINLTLVNGGPGGLNNASQTLTLTTNWQRFQITKSLQSDLNFLGLTIGGGQSMTSGSIEVWGAQIVNGTEAGTYDPTSGGNPGIAIGQVGAPVPNGIFQSYSYDSFGNLKQSGSFNFWQSYNERNRLNGYLYDAAGNLLSDGVTNVMAWDAESRLRSVGGATYAYDAEGNRVESAGATVTDTIYFGGKPLARYAAGQWTDLIYGPTGLLAETHGPELTSPQYRLLDHLGTQVATADAYGARSSITDYAPFGQIFAGGSNDPYKFTGKERDSESGLDYFGARYYASSMGRFMSPDWSAKAEPVPYAKLDNPQSLNLYSYVGNNPLSRVDPTGHADIAAECKGQSTCNKTLVQTVNIVHQQTDKKTGETKTVVDSTLKVTTKFSLTTDAKGNVNASASSTVENVSGHAYSASQLATMGTNIGTMQQAAVMMGFGPNTTQLVTGIGAAETRFGAASPYSGAPAYMNPAINPMQLTGGNGANLDLNHNVEGAMGILDWAGRPSTFDPTATYRRYSDHSPATMNNWSGTYGSITEQEP